MMQAKLRRNLLPTSVVGFALMCMCAILCAQSEPRKTEQPGSSGVFTVAGVVVSKASGAPLTSARVTLVEVENPRNARWMITAEDGRFEFNRLRAGKYSLQGSRPGFIPTAYEQHERFSTAIVTGPTLKTEELILRLVPEAKISGRIFDESGEPVQNATVRLYRKNRDIGVTRTTASGLTDTSDDQGYYDFWPLLPGTYYVAAMATPWYAVHLPSSNSDGAGTSFKAVDPSLDVSYSTTFYADTTEAVAATPVVLKDGDQAEIDIHLQPLPGSTPGEPDQGTEINLDGQESDSSPDEPLGSLTLSLKIAGEEKLPEQLFVVLRDAHLRNSAVQAVDPSGKAHFEGLAAGRYAIVAGSPGKPYFVSQTSSPGSAPGSATLGSSFELVAGSSLSLSARLVGGATRVEGLVTRSGKPAAGVMVVLVPADARANLELFRRDQSDLDGSFVMRGVVPGSYTVIAIEDGWDVDWSVPAVLARYTPRGERLTISPKAQALVSLPEPVELQPR